MSEISERDNRFVKALKIAKTCCVGFEGTTEDAGELLAYISALEAEVAALKPYRDGFDPKVRMPNEGENVWIAREGINGKNYYNVAYLGKDKFYNTEDSRSWEPDRVTRWFPLPQSRGDE